VRGALAEKIWQHDPTIHAPARYRRACSYQVFLPDPLEAIPAIDPAVAGTVAMAEDAIRGLNSVAQPALAPLARLLLRTESIASSKVEGMQTDARTIARAEARSGMGQTVGSEAREILANIDAMQLAIEEAAQHAALNADHILAIHRVLLERAPDPRSAGVLRTKQNWIGGNDYNPCGAAFVPPPPQEVEQLLNDLIAFCNDDSLSPLVQAALAHAQFETVHPFDDGNGRTGRALVQVLLRRRGIAPSYVPPISVVLAADKTRYIEGLIAFREGRENDWLETFAVAATRAADLAASYLERVRSQQNEWRAQLKPHVTRADAAAWLLIDELPAYPIISTAIGVAATGRTRPAVNQAIDQLVQAGILIPLGESKRNRLWEADGLLDLLAELDSAQPQPPEETEGVSHSETAESTLDETASDAASPSFADLLGNKRAQASVSVARRLIREGKDLRSKLIESSQTADASTTSMQLRAVREAILQWCEEVIQWSNDEPLLTTSQRTRFRRIRGDLADTATPELLGTVLDQNIETLIEIVGQGPSAVGYR
jgi:Fic family protein